VCGGETKIFQKQFLGKKRSLDEVTKGSDDTEESSKPTSKKSSLSANSASSGSNSPAPTSSSTASTGNSNIIDLSFNGEFNRTPNFLPPPQLLTPKLNNNFPLYNPFFYHNFFRFPPHPSGFQM
jgi:hypothetical protein